MIMIRRGERSVALVAGSALTTATRQADGVHGDAAPHDDVRRDDETQVLGHDLTMNVCSWRRRSMAMRSTRSAKYTSVNASTDTPSAAPMDASRAGPAPMRRTVGSWCSEFIHSTERC